MKCYILIAALFVASVHSRKTCVNWVDNGVGITSESRQTESPMPPKAHGNIISDLLNKAGEITSKTVEGVGNIAQGALQGTASLGQGIVNGAQKGLSSALETTGDVAAKLTNGVGNEVGNWWNALG